VPAICNGTDIEQPAIQAIGRLPPFDLSKIKQRMRTLALYCFLKFCTPTIFILDSLSLQQFDLDQPRLPLIGLGG
jgi:hypothetical protein